MLAQWPSSHGRAVRMFMGKAHLGLEKGSLEKSLHTQDVIKVMDSMPLHGCVFKWESRSSGER